MNIFELVEKNTNTTPTLMDAFRDFLPIAIKHLQLSSLPVIKLERNIAGAGNPTFGQFIHTDNTIYLDIENRHPVDIIRTFAHELVHYDQGQEHQLSSGSGSTGSPIEDEANVEAGVMLRMFDKEFPKYMALTPVMLPKQ